jgi:hypothetical protein
MTRHGAFDVVVLGGGLGGVAAALSGGAAGIRVALVSECDWIGGQVSSQCIPPDEHPWIEFAGCSRAYRAFRDGVRAFYRRHYPLTASARASTPLNPGLGNIGPLTHEPLVAELVLEAMLVPLVSRGLVRVFRGFEIVAVGRDGDNVTSIFVRDSGGAELELEGAYFLDGTDLGDLLDLGHVEHVIGAESVSETDELHALEGPADPLDQQAVTWAMLLGFVPGSDNTIERPRDYQFWRSYAPAVWPGPLFSWTVSDFVTHEPRYRPLFRPEPESNGLYYDLWHARRILAREQLKGDWESDVTAAAWPMMDYCRLPLVGVDEETKQRALEEARQLSLSFLYWMQTEAPRHDSGVGYPELRPRGDLSGTDDGLAKLPYIRESRRIHAQFTVLEQHVGVEAREGRVGAEQFSDSVGIGAYRIDLHPSTAGRDTLDLDVWPFQIPLGALLPVRVANVLPAAKNIGTTHLTNGAYRVHPVEWTIGEAVGALAGFCVRRGLTPQQVRDEGHLLSEFQGILVSRGIDLAWPSFEALTPLHRFGYIPTAFPTPPA